MHLFDPHLINSKVYNLVMRKNHKSCPSQVTMCEQFRVAFQTCDSFVVKTTGECQHDKRMENWYSLKNHDQNFLFKNVIISKRTQESGPDECVGMLQRKGIIFNYHMFFLYLIV